MCADQVASFSHLSYFLSFALVFTPSLSSPPSLPRLIPFRPSLPILINSFLIPLPLPLPLPSPTLPPFIMFDRMGDWLLSVAAEMPFETNWETSLNGSWYRLVGSPVSHVLSLCPLTPQLTTNRFSSVLLSFFRLFLPSRYLSPRRHTVEFVIYNALFLYTVRYFYRRALFPGYSTAP